MEEALSIVNFVPGLRLKRLEDLKTKLVRPNVSKALSFAQHLQRLRPSVVKTQRLNFSDTKSYRKALNKMEYLWKLNTKDKYFPALNGHKFSRTGREMFSDMTNDDYREEIKRSIEQIKDPNMGICVEADLRVTAAGDLKHEFRYTLPKTPIGHRTFWWWEGWFEN